MRGRSLLCVVALAIVPVVLTADEDVEGCKDSKFLSRIPGCFITECDNKEFDAAEIQVGAYDEKTESIPKKTLEGKKEFLRFTCPDNVSLLQIQRNAQNALKAAGYTIVYNGKSEVEEPMVTANKGATWVEVTTTAAAGPPEYALTTVQVEQMAQLMEANADAWAAAILASGRVAVYGLTFDTGKATLRPEGEPVLNEVLKLLTQNPSWKLRVEGHTDNVGDAGANLKLSEARAAAVVAWLVARKVDAARLTSQGFGDTKPVAGNDTEEGRAKNRRVELVKL